MEYPQALRRLEDRAKRISAAGLRAAANQLLLRISAQYMLLVGGLDMPAPQPVQERLRHEIVLGMAGLRPPPHDRLYKVAQESRMLGAAHGGFPDVDPGLSPRLDAALRQATPRALAALRAAQDRVRLHDLHLYSGVVATVSGAHAVAGSLERTAVWSIYRAASEGVREATERLSLPRLWIPEPGACLHCLAYAGETAQPGEDFTGGQTYYLNPAGARRPMRWAAQEDPPLHPWCRCHTTAYTPKMARVDRATTVKREAQRAVLSGRTSASAPAKQRAMDLLLTSAQPLLVPRAEQRRARRKLEASNG